MVSESDLELALDFVRARAAGPVEGIFGPGSMTWRIDREAITFLGAGRALLLQLAHPWVAAAVAEHSRTFADPIGRFHRTFGVVFTMVFGSLDAALTAARHLHRRHTMIVGRLPDAIGPFESGSLYRANEVAALRWVHATLVDTALAGPLARNWSFGLGHLRALPGYADLRCGLDAGFLAAFGALVGAAYHMSMPLS